MNQFSNKTTIFTTWTPWCVLCYPLLTLYWYCGFSVVYYYLFKVLFNRLLADVFSSLQESVSSRKSSGRSRGHGMFTFSSTSSSLDTIISAPICLPLPSAALCLTAAAASSSFFLPRREQYCWGHCCVGDWTWRNCAWRPLNEHSGLAFGFVV